MSSKGDINKMVDKAVNDIYPDVSEATNPAYKESLNDIINVDGIATETYVVAGVPLDTTDYKEKSSMGTCIIIVIIVIVIFIIIWVIAYNYSGTDSTTDDSTTTDTSEYDTNIGAIIQDNEYYIVAAKLSKKMKNKFQLIKQGNEECDYGYYGSNCKLQAHSVKYYNAGTFSSTYTSESVLGQVPLSLNYNMDDGSKDKNSCTSHCDFTQGCKGVIYDHDNLTCSLITSDVVASGSATINLNNSTQMYLKRNTVPQFTDIVVGFAGSKIMRYYLSGLSDKSPNLSRKKKLGTKRKLIGGIIHFTPNTVINTSWTPFRIANFGGYVGLYSENEFTTDNWQDTEMLYVDQGIGEYNIPIFLQEYSSLYVLYITKNEYDSV